MPRRSLFIRNEDIEAWDSMPDRPDRVHSMILGYKNAELGYSKTEVDVQKRSASPPTDPSDFPTIIAGIEDADD